MFSTRALRFGFSVLLLLGGAVLAFETLHALEIWNGGGVAFADEAVAPAQALPAQSSTNSGLMTPAQFIQGTVMYFLMGLGVFYALYLAPMRRDEDEQKKFVSLLKKNDNVLTTGGLFGKVVEVRPEEILVEIASGVKVRVSPSHVTPLEKSSAAAGVVSNIATSSANGSK